MPPQTVDPETLEQLKRAAILRAEQLGHHLQVFRNAKHDPHCYVSFCSDCRQMVLVNLASRGQRASALLGYALEAPCAARPAGEPSRVLATADSR